MENRAQTFAFATLFECGLGFAGVALAWWFGLDLRAQCDVSWSAVQRGVVACLPMFAMLALVTRSQWPPLVEMKKQVELFVRELFAESTWFELAVISASAGVGEELLFRGALQPLVGMIMPVPMAIAVVSLMFGLAHAVTPMYFVLATLISMYLGWMALAFEDLVAPIVTHAVYDFVALAFVQHRVRRK